jgi:hypothetical protein
MHEKHSFLLKYGERELQTLKEMQPLKERGLLPDNNNEIFRRGLHCVRHLVEMDEKRYLQEVVRNLGSFKIALPFDTLEFHIGESKNLTPLISAILMVKYGREKADMFERVVKQIDSLRNDTMSYFESKGMRRIAREKASPIRILLPKNIQEKAIGIQSAVTTFFL